MKRVKILLIGMLVVLGMTACGGKQEAVEKSVEASGVATVESKEQEAAAAKEGASEVVVEAKQEVASEPSVEVKEEATSEAVVYEAFGGRIGVLAYRRMASLLTQNVSKGVQDIRILLLQEAKEVMAQEKANIRQKGEQAGTKLLLPMTGLLLLVFAVLLVPAFRSF